MAYAATFEGTWQMLQETQRLIRETSAETERKFRETERLMRESSAETDRKIKDLARQVGSLSSRWGEFVEGVVAPGCVALFAQRGIPVHQIYPRVKARLDDGRMMEIDILVVNSASAVLVEVKSKLTVADVRDHLLRLEQFKLFFPRYADVRVMGAVAGIVSEEEAETFAHNQGLFVIVQSGETIRLANGESFIPRTW